MGRTRWAARWAAEGCAGWEQPHPLLSRWVYCAMQGDRHVSQMLTAALCVCWLQEHFYLEPNASIVVPGEADEMLSYSSTQARACLR